MARPKQPKAPERRESPIQFRPGTELGQLVTDFSAANHLSDPEACRSLIALAVTGMDGRYYGLLRQFADGSGGGKDFVRACVHVKATLEGAALVAGNEVWDEPGRSLFILRIVREALEPKGMTVDTSGLWFVDAKPVDVPLVDPRVKPQTTGQKLRRRVRTLDKQEDNSHDVGAEHDGDDSDLTTQGQTQPIKTTA